MNDREMLKPFESGDDIGNLLTNFATDGIKYLMAQDTTRDWAEAIAIAINNLKDKEGKLVRVKLSNDFEEHLEFCTQIAKQLRQSLTPFEQSKTSGYAKKIESLIKERDEARAALKERK